MKKLIIACFTLSVFSIGCGNQEEKAQPDLRSMIKGKWKIVDVKLDWPDTTQMTPAQLAMEKEERADFDLGFGLQKDKMWLMLTDSSYTFMEPSGPLNGQWKLVEKDSIIEFRLDDMKHLPQYEKIQVLDDKNLHLYDSMIRGVMMFERVVETK